MKLSLCIATHNEEKFIRYPLDSAYDFVDEVIIVDGGSIDKTVEIAKSYGAKVKVFVTDNPKMFHINKQKAIEKAKGEWILQLDTDEALSKELKDEIKKIVNGSANVPFSQVNSAPGSNALNIHLPKSPADNSVSVNGYWIPRKNFFLTRFLMKGGQYPDFTLRLYKNGSAHFPCKSVHENVEVKGKIGYLKSAIEHYADPSFSRYLARWNRYTSMDAHMLIQKGEKPNVFMYFIVKPKLWFFTTYFRHLGFMDGFPGFIFCLFSAIRFWAIYVKWWALAHKK